MPDFLIVLNNKKRCFFISKACLPALPPALPVTEEHIPPSPEHQQSHTGPLQNVHFPQESIM